MKSVYPLLQKSVEYFYTQISGIHIKSGNS